jgi:pyridinium-3,5-bisthiocarboxylic acid mononucleotide nickel chelatase
MKIAYFDLIGGASGDMLLGALLDAGLELTALQAALADLNLPGYSLSCRKVSKQGFGATKLDVEVQDSATERHLGDILKLIHSSKLPAPIIQRAQGIFTRLGEVEAGIHGATLEHVHLHELGGIDTIVDVTGFLLALQLLEIDEIHCSSFPLGRGFVRGAHGSIPLPAPATLALLKGAPVTGSEIEKELVTPTGAALLTSLAKTYGPIPQMTLQAVGYGAGGRDLAIPNLLRVLIGEAQASTGRQVETLVLLETNIDDLNPQIYDHLLERLFAAGALDATLTPMHMKKNRPAVQVSVLCRADSADSLEGILFAETSTLGIRRSLVERHALPRSFVTVETPYGALRLKLAEYAPGKVRAAPEYEDCRKLAAEAGVPLWEVYRAAAASYE